MMKMDSNTKEILDKAAKIFSIRVLGYVFGFLFTWILANQYGARIQGIFAISFLFLSIGSMVSKLGVETSLVKWIANASDIGEKRNAYIQSLRLILISSILVATLVFFLAPLIAQMYNKPSVKESVKLAALAIPCLSVLDISANFFKGEKRITTYGIYVQLLKFLLPLILISIFLCYSLFFEVLPILCYLIGLFLLSITVFLHVFSCIKQGKKVYQKHISFKFIILESCPMMISSAIVMIMGWSDVFILGFYVEEGSIGVYSTAVKLATTVSFVYNAIATIATPKIANFYHHNNTDKLKETISFSSKMMLLFGLPIFVIIFSFPEVLLNFFGLEYVVGKTVLRILLTAQFINVLTGPVGPIFQMTGRQKKLQSFIIIALGINIVSSVLLVNIWSLEGVAIASAFGMMFWNILGSSYIYKVMDIKTWARFI